MDIQYRLIPANTAFGKNKIGKIEPWSTRREDSSKDEWPRKSTKIAKENKTIDITSCLCVLCTAIRQNHAWSRGFFLAQRAPRAQRNNRKKERYVQSLFHLCDLSASARNSFLPGGFWVRLVALCSCSAICRNQSFSRESGRGTPKAFGGGMWKRISQNYSTAHHSPAHDSPDTSPLLLLPSPSSLGLRLAALRSFAAKIVQ